MCSSLSVVNIVTKSQYIFMKFIGILKCCFNGNTFLLPLKIYNIMDCFHLLIEIFHKADNSFLFMKFHSLWLLPPAIFKNYGKFWIKIGGLMKPALYIILLKPSFLKNLRIRQKIDFCSALTCLAHHWQQSLSNFPPA